MNLFKILTIKILCFLRLRTVCKNTAFFINKCLFLSLNLDKRNDIFVLSKEIKRERPKKVPMSKMRADRQIYARMTALLLAVFGMVAVYGQGREFSFGGAKDDVANALLQTRDGGFLLVGYSESFGNDNDIDVYVIRTDIDGNVLWSNVYDEDFEERANDVIELSDGSFLIVGTSKRVFAQTNVHLVKISATGQLIWSKSHGNDAIEEEGLKVVPGVDGGFAIVGTTRSIENNSRNILLVKVDEAGDLEWTRTYGEDNVSDIGRAITTLDGSYVIAGVTDNTAPGSFDKDIVLYRVDAQGTEIWNEPKRIATPERDEVWDMLTTRDGKIAMAGSIYDNSDALAVLLDASGEVEDEWQVDVAGFGDQARTIVEIEDGSLVIAGITESGADNIDVLIAQLTPGGTVAWKNSIGRPGRTDWGYDLVSTITGGYAITGYTAIGSGSFINDALLVTTDNQGNTITNFISGRVFYDRNSSCGLDPEDQPLKEWLVRVTGDNKTYFGTTDENGQYRIQVDTGKYNVMVLPINDYWEGCINQGYNVNLTNFYDTTSLNFPFFVAQACPYLEVDISAPFLVNCSDVEYTVAYRNLGTTVAQGAYVEVTLDDELTYRSSSIPPIEVNEQEKIYTFLLGNLEIAESGSFTIQTSLDCDGVLAGQAGRVVAHIFPDLECIEPGPNWDGSSVRALGECEQDTVVFRLSNIGQSAMSRPLKYYVVQEDVVLRPAGDNFQLEPNETTTVFMRRSEGATYRIIAEQSEDHPGRSYPTVAIEGCTETGEPYSTGYYTQFPENDQDNFVDIDVQEIISSISKTEMRGYPKGYRDSIIDPNTEITYKIFFKNDGTDAIQRVVIRDTIPEGLDITTLTPGASSHPYRFEIYEEGILRITFDNIQLLPDGSETENSNWGFVNFKVSQKPNNPLGTTITNSATIFFDYGTPERTNEIRYVVDKFPDFVEVISNTNQVFIPGVKINVRPNPFIESTTFEIEGQNFKEVNFSIFDMTGRLLYTTKFNGNQYVYRNQLLTPGMYVYKMESEGQLINSGKLLVR